MYIDLCWGWRLIRSAGSEMVMAETIGKVQILEHNDSADASAQCTNEPEG